MWSALKRGFSTLTDKVSSLLTALLVIGTLEGKLSLLRWGLSLGLRPTPYALCCSTSMIPCTRCYLLIAEPATLTGACCHKLPVLRLFFQCTHAAVLRRSMLLADRLKRSPSWSGVPFMVHP